MRSRNIRLHVNEFPWGINDGFEIGENAAANWKTNLDFAKIELNRYPDSEYRELREAIGNYSGTSYRNVCLGNGSDELIWLIFSLILDKGDRIFVHEPAFGEYERMAKLVRAETIKVCPGNALKIDLENMLTEIKRSNDTGKADTENIIAVICNPNNPTGELLSKDAIINFMNNFDGYVLLDEAYIDFCKEEESFVSLVWEYPKLIVLRTFSKGFGLAGIRLGYSISSEEIAARLNDLRPPYNINIMTEYVALEALSRMEKFKERIKIVIDERSRIAKLLRGMEVNFIEPNGNFIYVTGATAVSEEKAVAGEISVAGEIPATDDIKEKACDRNYVKRLKAKLEEKKILIRFFEDKEMANSFRFSIGKKEENDALLEVIQSL